ncbi:hypothetical protein PVK06_005596 [Gossypium arboreum]|uniref:Reverse transcriptase domain-containing protein n=1 Tax=Gossypium arboreum TaxID=29729 RepID=A0ABR0QW17_GOSAR|nr:hypothetical protein PVK06_005596 [Gossypium arboreum]
MGDLNEAACSRKRRNTVRDLNDRNGRWVEGDNELIEIPSYYFQESFMSNTIGDDVTRYCLDALQGRRKLKDINGTNIVLIPKINSPNNMGQFHPISLYNVIYKIISKVLVNRSRRMLDFCIDENQGAFVTGRQITDNILVAYEILNSFKKKNEGLVGSFALKIDMNKAYDKMDWSFTEKMMRKLGFCNVWINFIMKCVTTVSYLVRRNGIQ